jgi:hypothetical protein
MHRKYSIALSRIVASVIGCSVSGGTLDAVAIQNPSTTLQPYQLVSADGKCISRATTLLFLGTCDEPSQKNTQAYYILSTGSDTEWVRKPGNAYSVRIISAFEFDTVSTPEYKQFAVSGTSVYFDPNSTPNGIGIDKEFMMYPLLPSELWLPAANQYQAFPITGERTFRFGPAGGPYTYRTVKGTDPNIDGVGQCTRAFFPGAPQGSGMTCEVKGATNAFTPAEVQFRYLPVPGACVSAVTGQQGVRFLQLAPCTPASSDNVWRLAPAKYGTQ